MSHLASTTENCKTTREFEELSITKGCQHEATESRGKTDQFVTSLGPKVIKHNISWSKYNAQYKRQLKKQIASTALKFTEKTHFKPSNIEMQNYETHETLSIH